MELHIDYNPTPKDFFFVSVQLNEKEVISFDKTTKGHRMIKQVFKEYKDVPHNTMFDSGWDTIVVKDGKFVQKYHVQWIDQDKLDVVDGEVWETIWERPISKELSNSILHYSQLVSDNYNDLHKFSDDIKVFEEILSKEMTKISDL